MRQGVRPVDHPPARTGRIGVLLLNLGTPEGTGYWPMRRYLKEFLSGRRVIETPRLLWWPILNLIILTKRPGPKGRDYASIWNNDRNEGPLKTITRSQAEKLASHMQGVAGDRITVDWAMRYGKPEVRERIQALLDGGCDRILLVPLYPQYAAATSATACDQAFRALMDMRWQPTVRVSPPYHDDPVYIDALVSSMKRELGKLPFEPEVILVSFHGVPKEYLLKGDPYHCQCVKTWR
ncbi:MAG TPA: ferrochelatase, partial [Thermoanaerobaculia bacterium]